MIFCGQFGTSHRLVLSQNEGLDKAVLYKGEYDSLYAEKVSSNSSIDRNPTKTIPDVWNKFTFMSAKFNGNLHCGNFYYTTDEVKSIIIKRRLKDEIYDEWLPLFEIDINSDYNNFNFNVYDRYVRAGKEYEYVLVPILQQGTESNIIKAVYQEDESSKVAFDGIFILNYNKLFSSMFDVEISTDKNKPASIINPIGAKYPFVITTSENNYYTGNISATFLDSEINNGYKEYKTRDNWEYRQELNEYLQNGEPKIIKYQDGRMWMVSVYDTVSESKNEHTERITTSFNFVEIGDVNNVKDLYDNGFINYNPYNKTLQDTNNQINTVEYPTYYGNVCFGNGELAENINIKLFSTTDQTYMSTITDEYGDFYFSNLEDGVYIVSAKYSTLSFSATITVLNHIISGEQDFILT